jgi:hypothetical protein
MNRIIIAAAAITLSTSVLAGNMSSHNSNDTMHVGMQGDASKESILNNEEMQRLHKEMTQFGMSEVGMEARRKMIGTENGRAYNSSLRAKQKNTAG